MEKGLVLTLCELFKWTWENLWLCIDVLTTLLYKLQHIYITTFSFYSLFGLFLQVLAENKVLAQLNDFIKERYHMAIVKDIEDTVSI